MALSTPEIKRHVTEALNEAKSQGLVSMYPTDEELSNKADLILSGIPEIDYYSENNYCLAQDLLLQMAD